jgi:hypothetical protein
MKMDWISAKDPIVLILVVLFWAASAIFESIKKKKKEAQLKRERHPAPPQNSLPDLSSVEEPIALKRTEPDDQYSHIPIKTEYPLAPQPVILSEPEPIHTKETAPQKKHEVFLKEASPKAALDFIIKPNHLYEGIILKEILDKPLSLRR